MAAALIVIDVQTALCTGEWAMFEVDPMVDRINALAARARAAGAPVVFVQHEDADMRVGSDGWQIYHRLDVRPEDPRIRKNTPDSFNGTELQALLQASGVDTLVVCGLQSDYCIDSSTRGALARGFPVTLVSDGHSTMDNDVLSAAQITAHHNTTLSRMQSFGPRATAVPAAEVLFSA